MTNAISSTVRVGLVEPCRLYRDALDHALRTRPGFEVVFAIDPKAAVTPSEPPDIVLVTVDDEVDQVICARRTVSEWRGKITGASVVVQLAQPCPILVNDFVIAGARGVLTREDMGVATLSGLLAEVASGRICLSPSAHAAACRPAPFPPRLTAAQLRVARSLPLLNSMYQRQAAHAIGQNYETYRTLLPQLFRALGVDCWQRALVVCQEFNLVPRRLSH